MNIFYRLVEALRRDYETPEPGPEPREDVRPPSNDAIKFEVYQSFDVWQRCGPVEVMVRAFDPIGVVWVREAPLQKGYNDE